MMGPVRGSFVLLWELPLLPPTVSDRMATQGEWDVLKGTDLQSWCVQNDGRGKGRLTLASFYISTQLCTDLKATVTCPTGLHDHGWTGQMRASASSQTQNANNATYPVRCEMLPAHPEQDTGHLIRAQVKHLVKTQKRVIAPEITPNYSKNLKEVFEPKLIFSVTVFSVRKGDKWLLRVLSFWETNTPILSNACHSSCSPPDSSIYHLHAIAKLGTWSNYPNFSTKHSH